MKKYSVLILFAAIAFSLPTDCFAKGAVKRSPSDACDSNLAALNYPKCGKEAVEFAAKRAGEGFACEELSMSTPKEGSRVRVFSMIFGSRNSKSKPYLMVIGEDSDTGCILQDFN